MDRLLDLTGVRSADGLHDLLASFFHFPDYYGRNWNAFDECLSDFAPADIVIVRGLRHLMKALPRDARILKECLDRIAAEDPEFQPRYE